MGEDTPATSVTSGVLDPDLVERVVRGTRAFGAMIAGSLASTDPPITVPQWRVLELAGTGPQNVTGIAEDLGVHPSSVTRLCNRLVVSGLLDRRPSEQDRRQVVLTLTDSGRAMVDEVLAHRRRAVERIMAALPADRRADVVEAIDAFVAAAGR